MFLQLMLPLLEARSSLVIMSSAARSIVVHYHIFKNAGSTVDVALKKYFGARHGTLEGCTPWDVVSARRVADFFRSNPSIACMSSHQARLPLPRLPGVGSTAVLFLRHPVDRFGSVYEFERRNSLSSDSPSARAARSGDIRSFAEWAVSPDAGGVARNFQVLFLAGIDSDTRHVLPTYLHLELARRRLAALPFCGLVDQFDRSMQCYEALLKRDFPDFTALYRAANVSAGRANRLGHRLEAMRDELGGVLFQKVQDVNRLDLELYNHVRSSFESCASTVLDATVAT